MDPPPFMLAPLLMTNAKYQLWGNGILCSERLMGDLDYKEFSKTRVMPSFPIWVSILSLSSFLSLYLAYVACDDAQLWWSCQDVAGPVVGGPINPPPPNLPWSVYTYGPDGFARECPLGRNTNVIGYRFLPSTQVMSSLYSYPPSLSFFLSLLLLFCIPRVCLNNIFFSNLAYRGRARRACLACWERQVGGDWVL